MPCTLRIVREGLKGKVDSQKHSSCVRKSFRIPGAVRFSFFLFFLLVSTTDFLTLTQFLAQTRGRIYGARDGVQRMPLQNRYCASSGGEFSALTNVRCMVREHTRNIERNCTHSRTQPRMLRLRNRAARYYRIRDITSEARCAGL